MVNNNVTTEQDLQAMLANKTFAVVYPKDRTEKSAQKLVNMISFAIGVAEFQNEEGDRFWGALIDTTKSQDLNLTTE